MNALGKYQHQTSTLEYMYQPNACSDILGRGKFMSFISFLAFPDPFLNVPNRIEIRISHFKVVNSAFYSLVNYVAV